MSTVFAFLKNSSILLALESKVCTSGHRLCSLRRVCSGQAGSSGLRSLPVFPDNKRRLDSVQDVPEGLLPPWQNHRTTLPRTPAESRQTSARGLLGCGV